jgi:hypothetical protein
MTIRYLALVFVVSLLTGCAFGQKITYTGVSDFKIPENTSPSVGLAVSDKRPAVVSGDHSLEWVGYSRPPLGIPYGVHTKSGQPLSDDLASLVQNTLAKYNVIAQTITTEPFEDRNSILARLRGYHHPRSIIVTLNEWKTDSYVGLSVSLYYSVSLEVIDVAGRELGRTNIAGIKDLGSSYPLSQAVRDIFQELFNASEVKAGLESAGKRVT